MPLTQDEIKEIIADRKGCVMTRKRFHDALVQLQKNVLHHPEKVHQRCGICYNVRIIVDHPLGMYDAIHMVAYYSRDWVHHSGDSFYPVPNDDDYEDAWDRSLWDNPMRMKLLAYLISVTR